jgi:predicted glycoside hydrolase/deacetylase ChbG (UPF0249 family)
MSQVVTDGVLQGFQHGLLTSASVLANAPDAGRALEKWKALVAQHAAGALPSMPARRRLGDTDVPFDLGVHLNLTQGRPLGPYPAELLDANGCFPGVRRLFFRLWRRGDRFRAAMRKELERQIEFVRDQGLRVTHLNGHEYVEMLPAVAPMMPEMMKRFDIVVVRVACEPSLFRTTLLTARHVGRWPLACLKRQFARRFRDFADAHAMRHPDLFFGTAHSGRVDLGLVRRFLRSARNCQFIEVAVHPGEAATETSPGDSTGVWRDPLAAWRPQELRMLVSDRLPELLARTGWRLGRLERGTRD